MFIYLFFKERLKSLNQLVQDIESERVQSETTLEAINKAHEVIIHEGMKESSRNSQYQVILISRNLPLL